MLGSCQHCGAQLALGAVACFRCGRLVAADEGTSSGKSANRVAPTHLGTVARSELLENQWRLVKLLGQGAVGEVWQAHDVTLDRPVAIKLVHPSVAQSSAGVARFEREGRLLGSLEHPNLLAVLGLGQLKGRPFLVMPLLTGKTLAEAMFALGGRLSPAAAAQVLGPVCDALTYLHQSGVVHRDLKPANIFLGADETVTLMDLGSAPQADADPSYLSPEQIAGPGPLDGKSDVYALGCLLYEVLTGKPAFAGEPPQVLAAHRSAARPDAVLLGAPSALAALASQAMAIPPGERPTALEFKAALSPYLPLAAPPLPRRSSPRPSRPAPPAQPGPMPPEEATSPREVPPGLFSADEKTGPHPLAASLGAAEPGPAPEPLAAFSSDDQAGSPAPPPTGSSAGNPTRSIRPPLAAVSIDDQTRPMGAPLAAFAADDQTGPTLRPLLPAVGPSPPPVDPREQLTPRVGLAKRFRSAALSTRARVGLSAAALLLLVAIAVELLQGPPLVPPPVRIDLPGVAAPIRSEPEREAFSSSNPAPTDLHTAVLPNLEQRKQTLAPVAPPSRARAPNRDPVGYGKMRITTTLDGKVVPALLFVEHWGASGPTASQLVGQTPVEVGLAAGEQHLRIDYEKDPPIRIKYPPLAKKYWDDNGVLLEVPLRDLLALPPASTLRSAAP